MARLGKKIEDLMSAISFAEEGEFKTAKEMLKKEERVLLGVREGRMDRKTFKYAINTCKRIGASLDILYVPSGNPADSMFGHFQSELEREGIRYRMVKRDGCLKQAIVDYTDLEKDILFVVIESTDNLDADCTGKNKRLSNSWQKLKCPLVVVMEGAKV